MAMPEKPDRCVIRIRARQAVAAVVSIVLLAAIAACGLMSDGTESFRPPAAPIAPKASCDLPDIIDRLDVGTPSSGADRQREGSMPPGFTPTSVITCEVSDGRDGTTTIDEVTLSGNIDALVKALSRTSERTDANTSVSCAYATYAPAAIWLISPAGAVRAAWPTVVCGFRDDPLAPLTALLETGRTTVRTLQTLPPTPGVPPPTTCNGHSGASFHPTTSGARTAAPQVTRGPTLRLPEGPAAGLTACTYRISRSSTSVGELALTGQVRLSAQASSQLIHQALTAPPAEPCIRQATEIIDVTLYRPNGSGGGSLTAEADGCRRLTVTALTGYRTAPDTTTALLRGER